MGISQFIKDKAMELGFSACGIAEVAKAGSEEAYFDQWIAEGYHAGMKYMENHREIRLNPDGLVEGAKSVISVALNYYPESGGTLYLVLCVWRRLSRGRKG
mgnify:CR=1 FL=1